MKRLFTAVIVIGLLSVGWYYLFPTLITKELHEPIPQTKEVYENGLEHESLGVIAKVPFQASAHDVAGTASLIEAIDGHIYLRFENFEIINGPDVRVFLAKDIDKEDAIEIGPLKGTHGEFNYVVPESINLDEYSKVLVWSIEYNILFAFADFAR
jgi:hypothetical protein